MRKNHRRKLGNFLLDRTYQLRHAVVLVLLCAVVLVILGFYWYQETAVAAQVVEVGVISTMRQGDAVRLMEQLDAQRHLRLAVLVGGSAMLCIMVGVFVVVLTHTVAGPLHMMRKQMERIKAGRLDGEMRPLRRGDSLVAFYETFAGMVEHVRQEAAADLKRLEQAAAHLESAHGEQGAAKALAALQEICERKARQLGEPR